MKHEMFRIGLGLFFWSCFLPAALAGGETPEKVFLDWAGLKNPVLALPDRAAKDQAVVYDQGWFYFWLLTRICG